jgi:hypothetical protein
MDIANTLGDLAKRHRLARVEYRGAGQPAAPSVRVVEPYAIAGTGQHRALRCRQVEPAPAPGYDAWRRLRLDRIAGVTDAGRTFEPQSPIVLGHAGGGIEAAHPFADARPIAAEPGEEYAQYVLSCLLDGKLTEAEVQGAAQVAADLDDDRRRAIHARVFAAALGEAALDGAITRTEAEYLVRLSGFLHTLGWAPGTPA